MSIAAKLAFFTLLCSKFSHFIFAK
jgi:hypothetical protein